MAVGAAGGVCRGVADRLRISGGPVYMYVALPGAPLPFRWPSGTKGRLWTCLSTCPTRLFSGKSLAMLSRGAATPHPAPCPAARPLPPTSHHPPPGSKSFRTNEGTRAREVGVLDGGEERSSRQLKFSFGKHVNV